MTFPISGSIHIFGFFSLLFLSWRFLKYAKKENNIIAKFFGYAFISFALSRFFLGLPALFMIREQNIWIIFEIIERAFLLLCVVLLGYIIYFIKFPKHAKKITVFFVLFSFIILLGFIFNPPVFSLTESGILSWSPPLLPSILNFFLIMPITILGSIIFFREAVLASSKEIKRKSLGLGLTMLWSIIIGILDIFLANLNPLYSEINYLIFYSILPIILLFSYFSSKNKLSKQKDI